MLHNSNGEHNSCTVCGGVHWDWKQQRIDRPCIYCNYPTPGRFGDVVVCKICLDQAFKKLKISDQGKTCDMCRLPVVEGRA
jgi:hypothetical protein